MRRSEALALLGLAHPVEPDAVRAAFRDAARRLHPDRPDAPADATERMAAVNLAHAVLTGAVPADPELHGATGPAVGPDATGIAHDAGAGAGESDRGRTSQRTTSGAEPLTVELFEDGSLLVDAPAAETFERLLEAVDVVGDPTYVDADAGLLQIIVGHEGGPFCYLTFSLQGRAAGTEVFTTMERLDTAGSVGAGDVLEQIAATLRGA